MFLSLTYLPPSHPLIHYPCIHPTTHQSCIPAPTRSDHLPNHAHPTSHALTQPCIHLPTPIFIKSPTHPPGPVFEPRIQMPLPPPLLQPHSLLTTLLISQPPKHPSQPRGVRHLYNPQRPHPGSHTSSHTPHSPCPRHSRNPTPASNPVLICLTPNPAFPHPKFINPTHSPPNTQTPTPHPSPTLLLAPPHPAPLPPAPPCVMLIYTAAPFTSCPRNASVLLVVLLTLLAERSDARICCPRTLRIFLELDLFLCRGVCVHLVLLLLCGRPFHRRHLRPTISDDGAHFFASIASNFSKSTS